MAQASSTGTSAHQCHGSPPRRSVGPPPRRVAGPRRLRERDRWPCPAPGTGRMLRLEVRHDRSSHDRRRESIRGPGAPGPRARPRPISRRSSNAASELGSEGLWARLHETLRWLDHEIRPHMAWEDRWLYPQLDEIAGTPWATRSARMEHRQIERMIAPSRPIPSAGSATRRRTPAREIVAAPERDPRRHRGARRARGTAPPAAPRATGTERRSTDDAADAPSLHDPIDPAVAAGQLADWGFVAHADLPGRRGRRLPPRRSARPADLPPLRPRAGRPVGHPGGRGTRLADHSVDARTSTSPFSWGTVTIVDRLGVSNEYVVVRWPADVEPGRRHDRRQPSSRRRRSSGVAATRRAGTRPRWTWPRSSVGSCSPLTTSRVRDADGRARPHGPLRRVPHRFA